MVATSAAKEGSQVEEPGPAGHLAALAIEHQAELHPTDTDFGRFAGLRFTNPLA